MQASATVLGPADIHMYSIYVVSGLLGDMLGTNTRDKVKYGGTITCPEFQSLTN